MKNTLLNGTWLLTGTDIKDNEHIKTGYSIETSLPGDVHTTLINAGILEDPYWGMNEKLIQWVGQSDWTYTRTFTWNKTKEHTVLRLIKVDTVCNLYINENLVAYMENMHQAYFIDITKYLVEGENEIKLQFSASEKLALKRASKLTYPIPFTNHIAGSPNRNLVRKAQCHAGWDWGPCLMACGVYDDIVITDTSDFYIKNASIIPTIVDSRWVVNAELDMTSYKIGTRRLSLTILGKTYKTDIALNKGDQVIKTAFAIDQNGIEIWWPNGYGSQPLFDAVLSIKDWRTRKQVAFRSLEIRNNMTMGGRELTVTVNNCPIFMKGANWIPQDAIPSRITRNRYEYLLGSMQKANMNMIRIWGGGFYEFDDFYNICDKLGILIWHDMMFACATYPSDKEFLCSVEKEIRWQIRRLKDHPSIALWCGNNEDVGALNWYEESKQDRDRYLVDYDRLNNGVIARIIEEEDPSRLFWPSSPCAGPDVYSDNWHKDGNGDMHFWSVWHEGKNFEHYHEIKPRFCSEFGYQSFSSLSVAKSFAAPEDLNLTSPTFEHHQKSSRGNAIIIENFARYFRFPCTFENMLYLSQCQQALAIETAVTYWRSLMPYCMGTLFWQLNDVWPVASWASIEYNGKWKLLHYAARNFYKRLLPLLYVDQGKLFVSVANDTSSEQTAELKLEYISYEGEIVRTENKTASIPSMHSIPVFKKDLANSDAINTFARVTLASGDITEERVIFLTAPKATAMKKPNLKWNIEKLGNRKFAVTLFSDKPAFWVSMDAGINMGIFTDNMLFLDGKNSKTIIFESEEPLNLTDFKSDLTIYNLFDATH